jgi:hypothetical protein
MESYPEIDTGSTGRRTGIFNRAAYTDAMKVLMLALLTACTYFLWLMTV